jgi:hypothetical protein
LAIAGFGTRLGGVAGGMVRLLRTRSLNRNSGIRDGAGGHVGGLHARRSRSGAVLLVRVEAGCLAGARPPLFEVGRRPARTCSLWRDKVNSRETF